MKISRAEFISYLRANGGIYSRTAKHISEAKGIVYTRQQVRLRALDLPAAVLEDIEEESLDAAEERLQQLLRANDKKVALDAAKFILTNKGGRRGYGTKVQVSTPGGEPIEVVVVEGRPREIPPPVSQT